MKRNLLSLFLVFFFLLPLNLHAKQFYLKLTLGLIQGGDVDDALLSPARLSEYVAISYEKNSKLGQEIYLELIYQINSFLSFSVGNGYIHKLLMGKSTDYRPPILPPELEQIYTVAPRFSMEAIPICFSTIFSFTVTPPVQVNLSGGIGYYFVSFEGISKWETMFQYIGPSYQSTNNFKAQSNKFGYHLGAGFDVELGLSMFLSLEALYRMVDFKSLESEELYEMSKTSWYIKHYMGEDYSEDWDFRVFKAGLTGFYFRTGIKFKF